MTYPALVYPDHLEIALVHSGSGIDAKSKQLVDLNGSHRSKHLDMKGMGSHSKVNDMGLMNMIGNNRSLVLDARYSEGEDDFAAESDPRMDIAMLRNFGADIAQVQGFAQQMMAVGGSGALSEEQVEQLLALIENVASLVKLGNMQVAAEMYPQLQARMEELIEEIAEQLNEILEINGVDAVLDADGMPVAVDMEGFAAQLSLAELVAETLDILKQTADTHALNAPSLEGVAHALAEKLESIAEAQALQIEGVKADMIEQLNAILEADGLSEETRAEIEAALETIEGLEQGESISSELTEKLDALIQSGDIPAAQVSVLSAVIESAQKIDVQTAQFASAVMSIVPTLKAFLPTASIEALSTKIEMVLPAAKAFAPQVFETPSQAAASPVSLKVETSGATSNDNVSAGVKAVPVIGEKVEVKSPETNTQEAPDRTDTTPEGDTPTTALPESGNPDVAVVPPVPTVSGAPEQPAGPEGGASGAVDADASEPDGAETPEAEDAPKTAAPEKDVKLDNEAEAEAPVENDAENPDVEKNTEDQPPSGPCGDPDCKCGDDFGKAAAGDSDGVDAPDLNIAPEELERLKKADEEIENIIQADDSSDDLDEISAEEEEALAGILDGKSEPSKPNEGKPFDPKKDKLTKPWHECDDKCDHGSKGKDIKRSPTKPNIKDSKFTL